MSSGFISEAEITERRRVRQEEWDKVRSADQPSEVPEEPFDGRSLFDKLQDQKNKRDMEYEEAHKLKNMIKGLDDDEVEFLDLVDQQKINEEKKKQLEDENEMRDFKARVATLQEKTMDEKLKLELKKPQSINSGSSGRNSQHKLLAGIVVKKTDKSPTSSKRKLSETDDSQESEAKKNSQCRVDDSKENAKKTCTESGLKCIGILPGLGSYTDSSDSDCSSDSEHNHGHVKYDLLGRPIQTKHDDC